MILVVGGVKGGSGKTTIATNLAVLRSRENKVLLIDADEQRSAASFANQREALNIPTDWTTIQLAGDSIHSQIMKLEPHYDDIIIDAGGRDTRSQRSAVAVADIYLVPFKPRSFDVWTLGDVKTIIREMSIVNPKLKCYSFINQADPSGNDNEDTFSILKDCTEMESLNISIGNRKTFGNCSSEGLGVIEARKIDSKAFQEINSLYKQLYCYSTEMVLN